MARPPAAKVSGIGSHHAIARQDFIDRLAQRSRIDEVGVGRILIGAVMVIASTNTFADVLTAAAALHARSIAPFELAQQIFCYGSRIAQHRLLHRRVIDELYAL